MTAHVLRKNLESIQKHGPERTDTEIAFIIGNYCSWCPHWNASATVKQCRYCGCGTTNTIEDFHRRRIRNCPKKKVPATWDEEKVGKYLGRNDEPPNDSPSVVR